MTKTFHISERLMAYAKQLEAEAPADEPQPDLYTYFEPSPFYPGEDTAECGDGGKVELHDAF